MKRTLTIAAAALALSGCAAVHDWRASRNASAYEKPPFYAKYLNTGSALDAAITRTLEAVKNDPASAPLHNDLGSLLVEKGFPKDAAVEFERAVSADGGYFPAWYNLGLVRASLGDEPGARRAFQKTLDAKPGHSAALFQLGLVEEKRDHIDRAVALYAKAFRINPSLLEVGVNPRILDSKLTHMALLAAYPDIHARESLQFQDAPIVRPVPQAPPEPTPSPVAPAGQIVTPAPPAGTMSVPSVPNRSKVRTRRPRRAPEALEPEQQPAAVDESSPADQPPADQQSEEQPSGEQTTTDPVPPPPPPTPQR